MNWTTQQNKAIFDKGQNILVSAGAGSGKTAVLTERVFQHIVKDNWDVNRMLVLTFTNAAAAEMKERIRKKIQENEDKELSRQKQLDQLNKVDNSYIMTFDAFALSLVKKYHYLLNVNKDISIADSNILKIRQKELLDEILQEYYAEKDEKFEKLIRDYCEKDDSSIREYVLKIDANLNRLYQRNKYIEAFFDTFYDEKRLEEYFSIYVSGLLSDIKEMDNRINEASEYISNWDKIFAGFDALKESTTYEEIRSNCRFKIGTAKYSDDAGKAIKDEIGKLLKEIQEKTVLNETELKIQIPVTHDYAEVLLDLAEELNHRFMEYKKENGLFDFSDIFRMAIQIVDENEDIQEELRDYFQEILIDEYQDTNDLQDDFIARIQKDNIYMVGDIKQSIYRFRNANPFIFKEKYEKYKKDEGGEAIDLMENFRSRREVLEDINRIFSRMMDLNIGGADYNNGHAMIAPASSDFDTKGKVNQNHHLEVYSYDAKDELITSDRKTGRKAQFTASEAEAFIVARDIRKKLDEEHRVYDKDGKNLRAVEYKDFCIIIDRATDFGLYEQVLTYLNIPSYILEEEDLEGNDLLMALESIFSLINYRVHPNDDTKWKQSFVSLARSFLVSMKDSEIYQIVKSGTYWDNTIAEKIGHIIKGIKEKTIVDVLNEIIEEFDIYEKLSEIGDVSNSINSLNYFYQISHQFNKMNYSYHEFAEYLRDIVNKENENSISFNTTQSEDINAVKIMTIHKSKGLQFKICYFPKLNVKFNRADLQGKIFDNDYGMIIPSRIENRGLKDTMLKEIYKEHYIQEEISEKIRLFYVALTRSEEKMILILPLEDKSEDKNVLSDKTRLKALTFKNLLDPMYNDLREYVKNINLEDVEISRDYQIHDRNLFTKINKDSNTFVVKEALNIPSVSAVNQSHFSKETGLLNKEIKDKLAFGEKMHYYLELLDFTNPNYDSMEPQVRRRIQKFVSSDLMKNAKEAKVYREYEFIYTEENELKHGFIDLLMEYEDHFDIIDYKLKNIDDVHYDKQLNGYRRYIQSISNKPVNCYLYSIMDSTVREIIEKI